MGILIGSGIILVFAGLVLVGLYFPTSDGRTCRFTLWQIACFHSTGVAPGDTLGMLLGGLEFEILPLGILLIIVPLAALLWVRIGEH
jgi:hypothetical protein